MGKNMNLEENLENEENKKIRITKLEFEERLSDLLDEAQLQYNQVAKLINKYNQDKLNYRLTFYKQGDIYVYKKNSKRIKGFGK